MSTAVNIRLDDKQIEELDLTVEDMKKQLPRGASISRSSIIAAAVEDFLDEKDKLKCIFDLNKFNLEELKVLEKIVLDMYNVIPKANWSETPEEKASDLMFSKITDLFTEIKSKKVELETVNEFKLPLKK